MSFVQRLFCAILPRNAAEAMEKSSRQWMIRCNHCDAERSYWEIGGIRWGAVSKGKRLLMKCPKCERRGWASVYHSAGKNADISADKTTS